MPEPAPSWTTLQQWPPATPVLADGYEFQTRLYGAALHLDTGATGPLYVDNVASWEV